jgi:hypothetical protein
VALIAYVPGAQAVHAELLAGDVAPAAHAVQLLAVPPSDDVPAAQTEHCKAPDM